MADWCPTVDQLKQPFLLYAYCDVQYQGRAKSYLDKGCYLIIYKKDGSLLIHGCNKTTPNNYQPPGAILSYSNNVLKSERKKETIWINIDSVMVFHSLSDWSDHQTIVSNTEKDIVDKLYNNISEYIPGTIISMIREKSTLVGKIDLLVIDDQNVHHIIEAKRCKATINHCNQLRKYLDEFSFVSSIGYIAAPDICQNAAEFMSSRNIKYLQVRFT